MFYISDMYLAVADSDFSLVSLYLYVNGNFGVVFPE